MPGDLSRSKTFFVLLLKVVEMREGVFDRSRFLSFVKSICSFSDSLYGEGTLWKVGTLKSGLLEA
jgi:hypothetical protein